MTNIPKEFTELFEAATNAIPLNKHVHQVIVVRTSKNEVYCFPLFEILYGEMWEEREASYRLQKKEDTEITELVCMWNMYKLDTPTQNMITLLTKLNEKNLRTKILLEEKDSYFVQELGEVE